MRKRSLFWMLPTLLIAMTALIAAACGGDDDDADDADAATPGGPTATPTEDPEPWKGQALRFGLLPSEDAEKVLEEAQFLEAYLETELAGLDVELFIGPAYAATIEAMKAGKVDFAYFGPFSYHIARSTGAKAEAVLAFQNGDTAPGYYSVLYARNDTGVTGLEQLKGKEADYDFAFVDPGSTSGNLAPHYMLLAAGLSLSTIDSNATFAGGHDKTAVATNAGQIQVAASFEAMLYDLCNAGTIKGVKDMAGGGQFPGDCGDVDSSDALVTLEKFLLPASPIAYRTDMDKKLADAVIEAMLRWHTTDPEGFAKFAEVTEGLDEGESKLVRYGHENYQQISDMCSTPELKDVCPK